MKEQQLSESASPVTQSIEAVKALLAYVGRANYPLPTFLELPGKSCMLILSNKKDVYYTTTPETCSCLAKIYNPEKACKHQRKYFPESISEEMQVAGSIRPIGKWPGGFNGPVDMDTIKEGPL